MTSARRLTFPIAFGLLLLAAAPGARGQSANAPEAPDGLIPTAPVEVDGVVLFQIRGVSAFPAEMRAARRVQMILDAARDPKVDPSKLEIVEEDGSVEVKEGERIVGIVLEADARLEGLTRQELALAIREVTKETIVRYRAARTPTRLGVAAARAFAATAILALLIAVLGPVFRRFDGFVQRRWKRRTEELEEKSFELLRAERLQGMVQGLQRAVRAALLLALFYFYLSHTLSLFPWTRWIAVRLTSWIVAPLVTMGRAVLADIPDIIFLAILALVVRYGLKLLRLFFDGIDRGCPGISGMCRRPPRPLRNRARASPARVDRQARAR